MIKIINYGMGNLGSIVNMFKRIGVMAEITDDMERIKYANKLLLPGVGAFDAAMTRIQMIPGLKEVLYKKVVEERTPILGICLGMQLLTERSEEGKLPGLGYIPGDTIRLPSGNGLKIPHMGWNRVFIRNESPLVQNLPDEPRFYFVHSYHVRCAQPEHVVCTTNYGIEFHSVIQRENIFGAQFHPEKSHKFGMQLLENFAKL